MGKFVCVRTKFSGKNTQKLWITSKKYGQFVDTLDDFYTIWKISSHLENFRIVWRISGESERFPYSLENIANSLEDFQTV
jgi:hypothetical protein